ncbi:hypothetical protein FRB94_011612 [Tulasnella sp. JGI-2019a]|nr:hypothetical protein FRB94_011612 [Tulasnella sp. JGI-2019a]KAG9009217.1 hypothetical protein FRB93_005713 [Tulasnella sp. JGI-2019a]KAG9038148.1 hypothetical protein FRB95_002588 [Tulasnella sp. JGI-2019a]
MARSDRSSVDGSITSDGSNDDEQAVGPTSPVTLGQPTPWDRPVTPRISINTSARVDSLASPKSPISPSRWQEALDNLPEAVATTAAPGKPAVPNARFKAAILKVIKVNRMRIMSDEEPGIDPKSMRTGALYAHIKEQCSIEVIDYGAVRYKSTTLTNQELDAHISQESKTRPLWSKVRWINIGGVSWDVIRCLSLRYNIHPLAIEDMLHNRQTYSSKADYYSQHLFIRLLCHTLADEQPHSSQPSDTGSPTTYTSQQQFTGPPGEDTKFESVRTMPGSLGVPETHVRRRTDPVTNEEKGIPHRPILKSIASMALGGAQPWAGHRATGDHLDPESAWAKSVYPDLGAPIGQGTFSRKYATTMASMFSGGSSVAQMAVNELKKADRVQVNLRNLFVVMLRDGTLITIHQDPGNNFFAPILNRLRQRDTLLRNSSDSSMLLQNVLDLVVDNAVEVVDKYQQVLLQHERDILIRPKVSTVRSLHIASADIAMHKRTLSPIKTLIYGLRRYDLDRCIATANPHAPGYDPKKVEGFLSHKSKIYLADVMDHTDYILASLDMFGTVTENLIAYTFNQVSYDMNTTVRTLTIMTVIFFPLTFLTGYFGMNFIVMNSVKMHSELMFWEIALPVMTCVILIAFWENLVSVAHFIQKRKLQARIREMMYAG